MKPPKADIKLKVVCVIAFIILAALGIVLDFIRTKLIMDWWNG